MLAGCRAVIWDKDNLKVKSKILIKDGLYEYTINITECPDAVYRTTNNFEVGKCVMIIQNNEEM